MCIFCSTSEFHCSHRRTDLQIKIKMRQERRFLLSVLPSLPLGFKDYIEPDKKKKKHWLREKGFFWVLCPLPPKNPSGKTEKQFSQPSPRVCPSCKEKVNSKGSMCAQVGWTSIVKLKHHLLGNSQRHPRSPLPPPWTLVPTTTSLVAGNCN